MRTSINASRVKYVPQRTCIACRQVKAKRELIRLVRTPDGSIEVDTGGSKAGRGAYLCRSRDCWEAGLRGRLEYSLKTTLKSDSREHLVQFEETL